MVSEDDDGPAGKELVIVEIGFRESDVQALHEGSIMSVYPMGVPVCPVSQLP